MNVVAFSLYGTGAKYLAGAVENARLVKELYPGWEAHVWVGGDVPLRVVDQIHLEGGTCHPGPNTTIPNGMFWRFLAHDLPGIERYLIRDVDSRITPREVKAVNRWIAEFTQLHVMRDHPFHCQPISGGMWGFWKHPGTFGGATMLELCRPWAKARYGQDQDFLAAKLWASAVTRTVHDSCGTFDGLRNWPSDGPAFVGEYIDEFGEPDVKHRIARSNWLRKCNASDKAKGFK